MEVAWDASAPLTVREALERINASRSTPLAYTTVMTVMSRLADKEILRRERHGRGYRYEAAVPDVASIAVRNVVRDFGEAALVQFVDEARTDPALLDRLRRLIEEKP